MKIFNLLLFCLSFTATSQQCTEQCGPAPSRPSVLCPDGTSYSGLGPCAYNRSSRRCEWTTLSCPRTCNSSTCKYGATCSVVNNLATCSCAGRACITLFSPVCGSDGNTYPNSCSLGIKTCETQGRVTQVSTGECLPPSSTSCAATQCITGSTCREVNGRAVCECVEACTFEFDPRCGSDGNTYSNGCLMSQKTCQSGGAVVEAHVGSCEEPPTSISCAATTCLVGSICEEVNGRAVCKCAEACTEEYNPVCGSDGNTYGNPCLMSQKICQSQGQVTQAAEGECVLPVQCQTIRCGWGSTCKVVNGQATCDCPRTCTFDYNPICGTDGVTYGNACEMQYAYCNSQGQITQDREGECAAANVCPSGVQEVRCKVDPCRLATCSAYPNARCVANYCGGCFADFYDSNNRKVNCTLSGNNCPNHDAVNCFVDGCFRKTCSADNSAICISNYCGGCNWVFINRQGYPVDCGDTIPEQACTVSDWANHLSDWSYQKKTTVREAFNVSINGNPTLKTIVQSTDQSTQSRLLREAVAALLNSATDWNYHYSTEEVISMVQQAVSSNSKRNETLNLFYSANNIGNCPL